MQHLQRKYGLLSQVGRSLEDENLNLNNKVQELDLNLKFAKNEIAELREALQTYRTVVDNKRVCEPLAPSVCSLLVVVSRRYASSSCYAVLPDGRRATARNGFQCHCQL